MTIAATSACWVMSLAISVEVGRVVGVCSGNGKVFVVGRSGGYCSEGLVFVVVREGYL